MQITLCSTSSDKRCLTKIISGGTVLTGNLKNETGVINPVVLVEIENPSSYNYMLIPEFGRNYFITDMKVVKNNIWEIRGHVDVLTTYVNEIKSCTAMVDKVSSGKRNKYINDDSWVSTVKTKTDIINFSSGLSESGVFLLMACGG